MQYELEVDNIKCSGCATKVMQGLAEFKNVSVDLDKHPRIVRADLNADQVADFRQKLKQMGYPATDEQLDGLESITTKAKSFVSCASGRFENRGKSNT